MTKDWQYEDSPEERRLRRRATEVMKALKVIYPEAALALGNSDDFLRVRSAMRELWREL